MLNSLASLAMSTSVLKVLPGKLDMKRHSPSILHLYCPGSGNDMTKVSIQTKQSSKKLCAGSDVVDTQWKHHVETVLKSPTRKCVHENE